MLEVNHRWLDPPAGGTSVADSLVVEDVLVAGGDPVVLHGVAPVLDQARRVHHRKLVALTQAEAEREN